MRNIYLVRHGQSLANVDRTVSKSMADHAIPLTDLGVKQAQGAGIALREIIERYETGYGEFMRVWNSPYARTRQTAFAILEKLRQDRSAFFSIREDPALCEQQFGLFDGIPDDELPSLFPQEHAHYKLLEEHGGRFWARMPMGESRFDVTLRIQSFFGTIHRDSEKHGIHNIVVICHGVTMRAFIMRWFHHQVEWFESEPNPGNCDIYRIDCQSKRGHFVYKNGDILP